MKNLTQLVAGLLAVVTVFAADEATENRRLIWTPQLYQGLAVFREAPVSPDTRADFRPPAPPVPPPDRAMFVKNSRLPAELKDYISMSALLGTTNDSYESIGKADFANLQPPITNWVVRSTLKPTVTQDTNGLWCITFSK